MKTKHAIGLTVNGNEVRAAYLSLERGKAVIRALESTKLTSALENAKVEDKRKVASLNDLEKAFDIQDPLLEKDDKEASSEISEKNGNVGQIYSLLDRFKIEKGNLAINSPLLTVKYDSLDKATVAKPKGRKKGLRKKMDFWSDSHDEKRTKYIDISDNRVLEVDYEHHPPILDLLDEVNQFRVNSLNLVLMDTNELALTDLVKEIYKFEKDEITAIIYVEQDFSRVIFLKGKQLYHITPTVHQGSKSREVLKVIYSRILFAQDHYYIPELNKILVAGHSSQLKAKYFFREKFPSASVTYLNSKKIQSALRFKDKGLLFSRYAVPIALAWKALQKQVYSHKKTNFLPEYILDRQRMPKLAAHGYVLLILLAVTAFSFSWFIVKQKVQIRDVGRQINSMSSQIDNNQALTDRVKSFDSKIVEIETKVALVDSFSRGYSDAAQLLSTLNGAVTQLGDIWITEFRLTDKRVLINGMSTQRDKIPQLGSRIGGANLRKVTRARVRERNAYSFQLEKELQTGNEESEPRMRTDEK